MRATSEWERKGSTSLRLYSQSKSKGMSFFLVCFRDMMASLNKMTCRQTRSPLNRIVMLCSLTNMRSPMARMGAFKIRSCSEYTLWRWLASVSRLSRWEVMEITFWWSFSRLTRPGLAAGVAASSLSTCEVRSRRTNDENNERKRKVRGQKSPKMANQG